MLEGMDTRLMCIFGIETRNSYEENRKIYEGYLSNISFFQIHCQDVFTLDSLRVKSQLWLLETLWTLALTPWDPMDLSPPGLSVHGIFQARILERLPFLLPGDLPDPGIEPASPSSSALQTDSLPLSHWGGPIVRIRWNNIWKLLISVFGTSCF